LQHIAHHQFTNDPLRDPDVSQLQSSGHWLDFPLSKSAFVWTLVKQLWPLNLIRYIRIRAAYNALGTDKNPYAGKRRPPSKLNAAVGVGYLVALAGGLTALAYWSDWTWLVAYPIVMGAAVLAFYAFVPEKYFSSSRLKPVFPPRQMTLMRMTFFTLAFAAVAWASRATGKPIAGWLLALWVVPIVTSFSFFMVLRQLVQHGNADRGWLTNTRTFFVNPFVRFAVFPMGQDYHLPHHIYASVPHYNLKALHETLMRTKEYREQAVVVEGYFFPPVQPPKNPTVLDVVGPEYARRTGEVHLDHSVLEGEDVEDKAELLAVGVEPQTPTAPESSS
jgi:fatty acid desaturase